MSAVKKCHTHKWQLAQHTPTKMKREWLPFPFNGGVFVDTDEVDEPAHTLFVCECGKTKTVRHSEASK